MHTILPLTAVATVEMALEKSCFYQQHNSKIPNLTGDITHVCMFLKHVCRITQGVTMKGVATPQ